MDNAGADILILAVLLLSLLALDVFLFGTAILDTSFACQMRA